MTSLRSRLLLWLLPATFLVAVVASAGSLWGATLSLAGLLDEQLRSVAHHIGVHGERLTVDPDNEIRRHLDDDHADDVVTEVWQGSHLAFSSHPSVRLPPPNAAGLHDVTLAGQDWHTFVVREGDRTVRVAQAKDARWEALARVAVNLLWPILAVLPMLGVFLWYGIGYGLRPLRQIESALSRRDASSLAPIRPLPLPGEVKPLVDELNSLLQRLARAFEAQGDFIADASHELRTPAMALGVHVELARKADSAEERDAALRQVQRGVERLERLAGQLLTLARVAPSAQPSAKERVELAAACKEVIVDELSAADARNQSLGLEVTGDCAVRGDAAKLHFLVRNLVDNALRYSPDGSAVDIGLRREARGVSLVVQDHGPGIAPEERSRVLDRFYRGAPAGPLGSGLGLAIVKRVADEHGATLVLGDAAGRPGLKVEVFFQDLPESPVAPRDDPLGEAPRFVSRPAR